MTKLEIAQKYFNYKRQDRVTWVNSFEGALNKTVVEIPARSGSTRIKDKNIREVCGKPLLAYTILLAKQLKGVDRVIVNTDSLEYAAIAKEYGAEVPFLRPPELSTNTVSSAMATFYLKRHLMDEAYPLKKIVTMFPTSPFRNKRTIEHLIEKLDIFPFVCGGFYTDTGIDSILVRNGDGNVYPPKLRLGEDEPRTFFKRTGMMSGFNIIPGKGNKNYVHVINSPIELIDIDREEDLVDMQAIIENHAYDFGCTV